MPFLIVYRLLYSPLLLLVFLFKNFHPKLKKGFKIRSSIEGTKPWLHFPKNTQPLWFHCASGEFEYIKPVIRELRLTQPHIKILVTFFSPSVEKALSQAKDVDFHCPTPWDKKHLWKEFINHHKPRALMIARTDLWPSMIITAQKLNVPQLLFSKTVNNKQSRLQKFFSGQLMKRMTDIFCVSEEDKNLLYKQMKPYNKIHKAGDTRYDQCLFRIKNGKTLKPLNNFNKPIFIGGSTWKDDEDILIPLAIKNIKKMSFIFAPHEPNKKSIESIVYRLNKNNLKHALYSQTNNWDPESVLIVDQVGILADLYAWATMSFVGGTMARSAHSVLEPLAQGNLTFVGPHHYNNREAMEFKKIGVPDVHPVQAIESASELIEKVDQLSPQWTSTSKFQLQQEILKRSSASKIVVQWIQNNTN